jgi:hypothetical protein
LLLWLFGAVDPFTYEGHIKKTTAVVNLKGAVDIMVSPLMLEALQRCVHCLHMIIVCYTVASLHAKFKFSVRICDLFGYCHYSSC